MKLNTILIVILFMHIGGRLLYAQDVDKRNEITTESVIEKYLEYAEDHAVIFNGKEQVPYEISATNHPYLITSRYTVGEIWHNQILYKNILLRYDLYRDELVVLTPGNSYNIVLEKEKVNEATIDNYRIIRHDEGIWPNIPQGNYLLLLHDGNYPVIRKNNTIRDRKIVDRRVEYTYRIREQYYVYKDGLCHQVSNKRSLLKLFPDKRKELDTYIKQKKLNFRNDKEQSIVDIVEYYEEIKR